MASSSAPAPVLDERLKILHTYFSRVTQAELDALPARFDIPASFPLETPTRSEVIDKPGAGRSPLYVKHLEFGLRLPLHPFVVEVCTALGISPVQLKPNAIAAITAFIVICYWMELKPSLAMFRHLVDLKVYKKDPHCYFQNMTSFKLVEDLPSSIKDWKENFVWVEGDNLGLFCEGWPEANREGIKAKPLTSAGRDALDKLKSFSGSRKMRDLFDKSVLRVAGISPVEPSARDHERAVKAIFGRNANVEEHLPHQEARDDSSSRPAKRLREDASQVLPIRSPGRSPLPTTAIMQPPQQAAPQVVPERRQRSKVPSQGPRGSDENVRSGVSRPPALSIPVPTERTEREVSAGSSHRPGKEPSAKESSPVPDDLNWPYPHRVQDIDEATWAKLKRLMIGSSVTSPRQERDVREEDRFKPAHYLDKEASVIESRSAQKVAVEQFWLPRDREILAGVPDVGLHHILRSYLVRGAVVEEEIFRRMSGAKAVHEKLQATVSRPGVEEGSDLDKAMMELSIKENELAAFKDELKVREKMIEDLKALNAEKTTELDKLRGKRPEGDAETRSMDKNINEALSERDRALVQVELERQAAQSAKRQLEDEQIAHGRTRAENVRLGEALGQAQTEITHLRSSEWRQQVVNEWREDLVGRAEAMLACKAGYDYLWAQLPAELKSDGGRFHYPPRIASCVEVLEELEQEGGVFNLDEADEEEAPAEEADKMDEDSSRQPERTAPADGFEKAGESSSSQPAGGDSSGLPATPPPVANPELPLTPGAGMDFS